MIPFLSTPAIFILSCGFLYRATPEQNLCSEFVTVVVIVTIIVIRPSRCRMEAELASAEALIVADRHEEAAAAAVDLFELSQEAGLQVYC